MKPYIFFFLLLVQLTVRGATQQPDSIDYVLVINSYNKSHNWAGHIQKEILTHFYGVDSVTVYTENLNEIDDFTYEDGVATINRVYKKYKVKPKLVTVIGDSGWELYRTTLPKDWRDIPIVIPTIKKEISSWKEYIQTGSIDSSFLVPYTDTFGDLQVTGIQRPFYVKETIELMNTLMPKMKKIVFIADKRYVSAYVKLLTQRVQKQYFPDLEIIYMDSCKITTRGMLDSLRTFDENTGFIFYSWYLSLKDPFYSNDNGVLHKVIGSFIKTPPFILYDLGMESGFYAGGCFSKGEAQAKKTLEIINEILSGKKAKDIPIVETCEEPQLYLDYNVLSHFHLPPALYPEQAVYYNKPLTFIQRNRTALLVYSVLVLIGMVIALFVFMLNITKRRQAKIQKALQRKYQDLFDNMPILYARIKLIYDIADNICDYTFMDVNPAYIEIFERYQPVGLGVLASTFSNPLTEEQKKQWKWVDRMKESFSSEFYFDRNGRHYDLLFQATSISGEVDMYFMDKTERIKAMEQVQYYADRLSKVLDNLPIPVMVKDALDDFRYVYWNKEAEIQSGIKQVDAQGKTDYEIYDQQQAQKYRAIDTDLVRRNSKYLNEETYRLPDGKERSSIVVKSIISNYPSYAWLLLARWDITERRDAEKELLIAKENAERAIQTNSLVLKNINIGLIYINLDYVVQWESTASIQKTIKNRRYIPNAVCFQTVFGRKEPCTHCVLKSMIESGKTENYLFHIDGRHVDIIANPVYNDSGVLVGGVMKLEDITEKKQTEVALEAEKQSNKLKSSFLANMSHEIRTPLNAIVGFSNLLATTADETERLEYSGIISTNNILLLQLIDDIIELSKIESDTLEFIYTEVDLNALLDDLLQPVLVRCSPDITISIKDQLPKCVLYGEKNRLSQVLRSFINNAIKFTEKGSISFGYRLTDHEKTIRFYVTDTGRGIPESKLQSIFKRFVKVNSFDQGSGLGLSISESIITKMGGSIGVNSKEGEGSTFWFTIPYKPV